jgi:hypothetical protein
LQLFRCQHCGQIVYFENTACLRCSRRLGYIPEISRLSALEPQDDGWRALASPGSAYRFCANAEFDACNWLVAGGTSEKFCAACSHNRTIPNLGDEANLLAWRKIEAAKHRLLYTLLKLRLPLGESGDDTDRRLTFDFVASVPSEGARVLTGHDNGLITLAVEEADDVERERRRVMMHEPYRTLLGHFRHEVGHYYWDRLVRDADKLEDVRRVFGDDRIDYGEALQTYYAQGAPADWPERFISAYATSHPWEDFAETWAHYLHIVDTLEMADSYNMNIHPKLARDGALDAAVEINPYREADFNRIVETWIPLSNALNSLNRAMGMPDLYPFVLSVPVIGKLKEIHDLVRAVSEDVRAPPRVAKPTGEAKTETEDSSVTAAAG